jgi:hypothetical protein
MLLNFAPIYSRNHAKKSKKVIGLGFGDAIYNLIPNVGYIVIHFLALAIGAYTAKLLFDRGWGAPGKLVALYAVTEVVFLLAHLDVLTLPFSHLLAEVLLLVGVLFLLMAVKGAKEGMKK